MTTVFSLAACLRRRENNLAESARSGMAHMKFTDCIPLCRLRPLVPIVCILALTAVAAARSKFNEKLSVGDAAPEWRDLPGADGRPRSLADFKDAEVLVILFTGSHCPMTKVYEERVRGLAARFAEQNVGIVAINVDHMKPDVQEGDQKKSGSLAKKFPFPYLFDPSQKSARAYGATVTPQFFVLDAERKIAYMGAFDDNARAEKVEKHFLANAISALLEGKPPPVKESLPRGCEIRYAVTPTSDGN
jgi:peroxiredoxin